MPSCGLEENVAVNAFVGYLLLAWESPCSLYRPMLELERVAVEQVNGLLRAYWYAVYLEVMIFCEVVPLFQDVPPPA